MIPNHLTSWERRLTIVAQVHLVLSVLLLVIVLPVLFADVSVESTPPAHANDKSKLIDAMIIMPALTVFAYVVKVIAGFIALMSVLLFAAACGLLLRRNWSRGAMVGLLGVFAAPLVPIAIVSLIPSYWSLATIFYNGLVLYAACVIWILLRPQMRNVFVNRERSEAQPVHEVTTEIVARGRSERRRRNASWQASRDGDQPG